LYLAACRKNFVKSTETEIEDAIADVLKYAPKLVVSLLGIDLI